MNWNDERWIRLYTRDTTNWLLLSWQAQALLLMLLRKVDRAGQLPLKNLGKRAICTHLKMPWDVAEPALNELLSDGCLTYSDGPPAMLTVPNFVTAQEAVSSPSRRQREWRERKKRPAESSSRSVDDSSRRVDERSTRDDASTNRNAGTHIQTDKQTDIQTNRSAGARARDYGPEGPLASGSSAPTQAPDALPDMPEYPPLPDEAPPDARRQPPPRQERGGYAVPGSSSQPNVCSRCGRQVGAFVWEGTKRVCMECRGRPPAAEEEAGRRPPRTWSWEEQARGPDYVAPDEARQLLAAVTSKLTGGKP